MIGFKHLMTAYQPINYRACATSAMREAENRAAICDLIERRSGISVEVIDGREEAEIIFSREHPHYPDSQGATVYLDVGGGSTEITILRDGISASHSFNIGTIRVMKDMVTSTDWDRMQQWVQEQTTDLEHPCAIGSGGNIHKIVRLSKGKDNDAISMKKMRTVRKLLKAYTVAERITKLGLKPDRADVILHAHKIYYSVMKWGRISSIQIPQMGLADGMVRQLYYHHRSSSH
jgi:exopolyphosphatase/guanosine-5'-triphosphate,3'-diphosphate pyrophosphatase